MNHETLLLWTPSKAPRPLPGPKCDAHVTDFSTPLVVARTLWDLSTRNLLPRVQRNHTRLCRSFIFERSLVALKTQFDTIPPLLDSALLTEVERHVHPKKAASSAKAKINHAPIDPVNIHRTGSRAWKMLNRRALLLNNFPEFSRRAAASRIT